MNREESEKLGGLDDHQHLLVESIHEGMDQALADTARASEEEVSYEE